MLSYDVLHRFKRARHGPIDEYSSTWSLNVDEAVIPPPHIDACNVGDSNGLLLEQRSELHLAIIGNGEFRCHSAVGVN